MFKIPDALIHPNRFDLSDPAEDTGHPESEEWRMDETVHEGGCLCGSVRFTTKGQLGPVIACHCSQCRRQTGLYYATTDVTRKRIRIEGEEAVSWYRASDKAARGFCSRCGSALFWQTDGADRIAVMAGAFDQPSGLAMDHHIYCADKADFYQINDGLPQYDTYPPAAGG